MATKKSVDLLPLLFVVISIMFAVYVIVMRESDSSFVNMISWFGKYVEGFSTANAGIGIKCPQNMKFFNDARGGSFCCGATVNPYGATCSDPTKVCAFVPNVASPSGGVFPLCK